MISSSSIRFLDQYSNQVRTSSSPPPPSLGKRNDNITVTPRCSKAQMCLHKILHIITSHQQQQKRVGSIVSRTNGLELMNDDGVLVHKDQNFMCSSKKRLLGIDLNLRLGCLFDESATIEKSESSSQGECEPKLVIEEEAEDRNFNGEDHKNNDDDGEEEEEEEDKEEEATDDHSEITNLQFQSSEKDQNENLENGQCQKHEKSETVGENLKNEGFLGLLVEAARWVSENYSDDGESDNKSRQKEEKEEEEEEEKSRVRGRGDGGGREIEKEGGKRSGKKCNKNKILGSKRKEGCDNNVDVNVFVVEYEDDCKSPVVRSKRGRSQVLPVRYRDSVLEPWKKGFSRPPPRVVAGSNKKRKSRYKNV